jgi:NAD(P)-dependent dehydrogenase (short-subunit alcohol dehydrogenase family)
MTSSSHLLLVRQPSQAQLLPSIMSSLIDPFFKGKVIVITGGAGQFGSAAVIHFLELGCQVAALDISLESLNTNCPSEDSNFIKLKCDVSIEAEVLASIDAVVKKFNRVDLLFNNAGVQGAFAPTLDYPAADFMNVMNVNVLGIFNVLKACGNKMKITGGGSIVNTSSVAAMRCTPAMVAYASSKAAVLALTVVAAKDLAPHAIRVNAVSPALIDGPLWDRQNELHATCDSPYFASDKEEVVSNKIAGVPMKRLGTVEEVIQAVQFLLSDQSSYTNGTNIVVDGGLSGGFR